MARIGLAALAVAVALAAGGCGGEDDSAERKKIESSVHAYFRAFAAGDTGRVCSLMTTSARDRFLEAAAAKDCPSALGSAMDEPRIRRFSDRLQHARVVDVKVGEGGSTATVKVAALGVTSDVPVRKEDDQWKLDGVPDETASGS
jgi:hypothetical protein